MTGTHGLRHTVTTLRENLGIIIGRSEQHRWQRNVGQSDGPSPRQQLENRADSHAAREDWQAAVQYYLEAQELRESAGVHRKLGRAFRHLGNFESASRHYERALKLDSMRPVSGRRFDSVDVNEICTRIIDCREELIKSGIGEEAEHRRTIDTYSKIRDGIA